MTEATGREARTLHRLLGWTAHARGEGGGGREIEATALVVDESSMMDLYITHEVLRALPDSCRLILVGDADQLPSVGAGNVLADIVASGAIPVARLSQIFRQSEGSSIADAAREINDGRVPSLTDPRHSSDMWQVAVSEPAEAADKVVKLMSDVLPRIGWDPLSQVQVLTPGHAHDTGTISLNERLQAALNPPSPQTAELTHARKTFRVGDRVIQTTNNYDLEVFNGDIGNVVGVTAAGDDPQLLVDFDGHQAVYRRSDMDELQLAYAISIHKSQGSEFPVVVCALTTQHYVMLRRNLVYTAVTRARKLCAVVGQKQALATAVRRDGGHRITGLAGRLAGRALTHDAGVTGPAPDARPDPEEIF
jgi:exodeoxyribonuclease V alpha subunit